MTPRRRGPGLCAPTLAALLVVVLAACDSSPTPAPTATAAPEPTAVTSTYPLGTTVWYAGFVLSFGEAVAVLDQRGGTVTVELHLDNPGEDDLTLDFPITLTIGGTSVEPTRETVLPSVVAGASAFTTLHFDLIGIGRTTLADAVLKVGAADRHQGIVPFGSGGAGAVTLEPVDLALKGSATAGDLHLVLSQGVLRWDLPDWADELPASTASLTVTYDVTYTGTFVGGTSFTGDNIGLLLPDGTFLNYRPDGRSQSVGVIGPGKTLKRLSTRFEIPADMPGTYTLLLGYNGKQGKIRFTLPA